MPYTCPLSRDDLDIQCHYSEADSAVRLEIYQQVSVSEPSLGDCLQRDRLFAVLDWDAMSVWQEAESRKCSAADETTMLEQIDLAIECE